MTFIKNKEDFTCGKCDHVVVGNGYTNHCSQCLWSRHVDINPGDRAAECGGLMEPVQIEIEGGKDVLTHRCTKCSYQKRNEVAPDDDYDKVVVVATNRRC